MSAIVAYTGPQQAVPLLIDALTRQQRIGQDSAGIAIVSRRRLRVWKAVGPVNALALQLPDDAIAHSGIAHLRLATHGMPAEANTHPHLDASARVAIVHNGVIDNADRLRRDLTARGTSFVSETDSEVIAALVGESLRDGAVLGEAIRVMLEQISGTCGLAVLDREAPECVAITRIGSPMFVATSSDSGSVAASDADSFRNRMTKPTPLDDGDIAILYPERLEMYTDGPRRGQISTPANAGKQHERNDNTPASHASVDMTPASQDDGAHDDPLHEEICGQASAIERVLAGRLDRRFGSARLGGLNLSPAELRGFRRLHILGCGSAWHAALSGARMIESLARIPATAESAGEFRYRHPVIEADTLYVVASRSGETFDSLAALREIRQRGGTALGVINDVGSTIAREVHGGVYLHAGRERSVVATRSVSAMLTVFALIALMLGRQRDVSPQRGARLVDALDALPGHIDELLKLEAQLGTIARTFSNAESVLFTGRAAGHAIALEGARKLSEASAIHTLACPAAELAHGPIALLNSSTPCIVLLPEPDLQPLSLSLLETVKARGAPLIVFGASDEARLTELADRHLPLPRTEALLQPIVAGIALQLLAYHAGTAMGHDVNCPANLSERVTME